MKKLLSLFIATLFIVSVTAINVQGESDSTIVHEFSLSQVKDCSDMPGDYTVSRGIVHIASSSTKFQYQHQMLFSTDSENMAKVIKIATQDPRGKGVLAIDFTLTSCKNAKGESVSPEIVFMLIDSKGINSPATQSAVRQAPGTTATHYVDVTKVTTSITGIALAVRYEDLKGDASETETKNVGCADVDASFSTITAPENIYSYIPDAGTVKTLFNFRNSQKRASDYPSKQIFYKSDSTDFINEDELVGNENGQYDGTIKVINYNPSEKYQMNYGFNEGTAAEEALNYIRSSSNNSNTVKMFVNLNSCLDSELQSTIAEISISIFTKSGKEIKASAWQYPGTIRWYYFNLSTVKDAADLDYVSVTVQNTRYYDRNHRMINMNADKAAQLGYVKCDITPTVICSPIYTVDVKEYSKNYPYDSSLIGYNNDGKIPNNTSDIRPVQAEDFNLQAINATYNGKEFTPAVTSKITSNNYDVSYSKNINAGTAVVTIKGKDNFSGTATKTFVINAISLSSSNFSIDTSSVKYTGSNITKSVKSKYKLGTDYFVSYKNNKSVGKATVTVTGKGNYKGTVSKTFNILAPSVGAVKKASAKGASKSIKVSWGKVSGANGYTVQYSTKSNFKAAKTIYVSSKNASLTINKLKKGTKYYVKVAAYKNYTKTSSKGTFKQIGSYKKISAVKAK